MFVDDTTLFFKHKEWGILYTTINVELAKISQWFKFNKLCLNIKKPTYIVFRNKNSPITNMNLVLKIDDLVINKVEKRSFWV